MLYIQDRSGETVAIVSDYYNDMHKMYTQSGTGSYDFTVSRLDEGQEFIIEGNYVVMLDDEGKAHQFTIMKVTETETEKNVECEDASLQLLNKQRRAWAKPATAQPISYYANKALQGTGWGIGYNEVPNLNRTLEWTGSDSSLNRLFSIATQFDNAELDFHVELDRTRVIKRVVDIKKKLGSERNDIQLVYGDTVVGIQKTVSILNFRTALYGMGALVENTKEGEPEKHYDFSSVEYDDGDFFSPKGDPMLYARKANERFNLGQEYIDEDYSFDTKDPNELLKHTLTHLKEVSEPEINYEVELADFEGLHLTRGDTVRIIDHGYNPELLITARVIELDKSYTDPSQDKAIFGNFMSLVSGIDPMLLKIQQQIQQMPKARTPYPWVRYADDDKGTGMSMFPAGKAYMATVWSYETAVPSDNPVDYAGKWIKVKGEDGQDGSNGIPGPKGADGQTSYFHTAWADDISGTTGFTTSGGNGKAYIGTYSDLTKADSEDPSKYKWALFKGEDGKDGKDGQPGKDGTGIKTTVVRYQASSGGTTHPTGTWTSTVPAATKGQYLWTRTDWTYTDNSTETGYSVSYIAKDGNNGTDGVAGKDGVGIKTTTITYASSSSGTTAPTSGWTANPPATSAGHYIWTKTVWTYTDSTSETGYSVGKIGDVGPKGLDGKSTYTHIAYAKSSTGVGFSQTPTATTTYVGMYVDQTATDSTDPSKYKWTLIKGADGSQGTPGKAGTDGKTPYLHTAYSWSADGTDRFMTVYPGENLIRGTYAPITIERPGNSEYIEWVNKTIYNGLENGKTYTFSAEVTADADRPEIAQWGIRIFNFSTNSEAFKKTFDANTGLRQSITFMVPDDDIEYDVRIYAGDMGTRYNPPDSKVNITMIDYKLEYVNNSNPIYTPSPLDDPEGAYPKFIGTYTDYIAEDSTDPSKYTWAKLRGEQGLKGERGKQIFKSNYESVPHATTHSWSDLSPAPSVDNPPKIGDTVITPSGNILQIDTVLVGGGGGGGTFGVGNVLGNIKGPQGPKGDPGSKDVPVITSGTYFPTTPKNGDQHWKTNSAGTVIGYYKFNGSQWVVQKIDAQSLNVSSLSALTANLGTVNAGTLNGVKISAPDIVSEFNGVLVRPVPGYDGLRATGDIRLKDGKIELQGKIDGTTQKFYSGMTYEGIDSYMTDDDGSTKMHSASLMYGELALDDLISGLGTNAKYLSTGINAESLYINSTSSINWLSQWSNFAGTPSIFRFGAMVAISGYIQTSGANVDIMRVPDWAKPASTSYGTGTAFNVTGYGEKYESIATSFIIRTNGVVSVNRPAVPNGHVIIVLVYKGAKLI